MKTCFIVTAALLSLALPLAAQSEKPATRNFPEEIGAPQPSIKTLFPEVRTTHEMVGGGNNFVTEAGMRMLRAGGNAVDAGIAAVLAAAVTEEDHFSMGGEMPLLIKLHGKPVEAVSGVGVSPANMTKKRRLSGTTRPGTAAARGPARQVVPSSLATWTRHVVRPSSGASAT